MSEWFSASKEGLAKLVADKPKVFLIHELLSNAYDTGCDTVRISLDKVDGRPQATLLVEDDHPEGFANLAHAWTLFAESERKGSPETAGRYNMGEKLVLACCEKATITTTTGRVTFDKDGRTVDKRKKTPSGSEFWAVVRMTHAEFNQVLKDVKKILFRPDVNVTFNGKVMKSRDPLVTMVEVTLPTILGDDEGRLRRTQRQTTIEIYDVRKGEEASIYELGIPVVATGDAFHVNVRQKVPLNMDRDNVTPGFLKKLRGHALTMAAELLSEEQAAESWVTEALGSKTVAAPAVRETVIKRFGEKAAVYDPSDTEANGTLMTRGFNIVHGGSLPAEAWENVRSSGALKPSGQIAPTPKPYSNDPDAAPVKVMHQKAWTPAMREVVELAVDLHRELFGEDLEVRFVMNVDRFAAAYGHNTLDFFTKKLKKRWFETVSHAELVNLLVHEFAHRGGYDHNEEAYHKACTRLAGQISSITYRIPEFFEFLYTGDHRRG